MTAKETMEWLDSKMSEKGIMHTFSDDAWERKKNHEKKESIGEEDGSTYQIIIRGKDGSQISDCIMIRNGSYGYSEGLIEYYRSGTEPEAVTKEECLKRFQRDWKAVNNFMRATKEGNKTMTDNELAESISLLFKKRQANKESCKQYLQELKDDGLHILEVRKLYPDLDMQFVIKHGLDPHFTFEVLLDTDINELCVTFAMVTASSKIASIAGGVF